MQPPIYEQPLCLQSQGREFIELLGKSHVLRMLFFMSRTKKPMRFNQLKREIGITATTLGRRLDEMIGQGLVDREVFAEVPARVEYDLSEKGRTLGPILKSVFEWVGSNNSQGDSEIKVISKFKVTKGYEVWKKAFESNETSRLKHNVRVLAYGHEAGNESNVDTVVEMGSIEDKRLKNPSMIKFREEAGVDHASLEIIALVE